MGVSIEQWRNAIGCHSSNFSSYLTKTRISSGTSSSIKARPFLFILTFLGILNILTALYTSNLLDIENHVSKSLFSTSNLAIPRSLSHSSSIVSIALLSAFQLFPSFPQKQVCSTSSSTLEEAWSPPSFQPAVPWLPSTPLSGVLQWSTDTSPAWQATCSEGSPPPRQSVKQVGWSTAYIPSAVHWSPSLSWQEYWPSAFPPKAARLSTSPPSWLSSSSRSWTSASGWLSSKKKNKLVRARNGNRQNRGIKIAHWNAGSAHLKNKMNEIEYAVSEYHPHLLGISEANLKRGHDIEDVQLQEYDLFVSKTMENDQLQVSRVVCYKHQSLVGKMREDLMSDQFSSIWMEIGLPGKRKFLVCQLYREWRYLGQPNRGEHSATVQEQMRRWVIFLDQWEQALATGKEVIVLGDCNLDHFKFNHSGVLQPLVDTMMNRIYPHGVAQCVQVATHFWPGQTPSGLDHIYTNVTEKLSQVQVKMCGSSDHKLILATRHAKNIQQNIRYCKKRSYKNFDEDEFLAEVAKISQVPNEE